MIVIIDFGSQFNQLIARRVRECRVYCQIEPPTITAEQIQSLSPEGIILSGGPASIYEKNSPKIDSAVFDLAIPVLGICYGMHFMVDSLGGSVKQANKREYGFAALKARRQTGLFSGIGKETVTWMSHGDSIDALPKGFSITASTANTKVAAMANARKKFFGVQFHPEKSHEWGEHILLNFLRL